MSRGLAAFALAAVVAILCFFLAKHVDRQVESVSTTVIAVEPARASNPGAALDPARDPDPGAGTRHPLSPRPDVLPSPIVAGVVVDVSGQPVDGAKVEACIGGPDAVNLIGSLETNWAATTDGAGRFEIHGSPAPDELLLSASKSGYCATEPSTCARGSSRVTLVLTQPGVVAGRAIADATFPLDAIEIVLECLSFSPQRGEMLSRGRFPRKLAQDGSFSFDGICTREARLVFRVEGAFVPEFAVESILVRPNGSAPDPRLDPIDLRALFRVLTLDVLDPSGEPCEGAMVAIRGADHQLLDRAKRTQGGRVRYVIPPGPCDVDVERLGCRRERLSGVATDQTVHLRRGRSVRVVLDGILELPPFPNRLEVALMMPVQSPSDPVDGMGSFHESGEAIFDVSSPGRHHVAWFLATPSGRRWLDLPQASPEQVVEILDREDEQVVHLDLVPEVRGSWERTLRDLREGK